MKNEVRQLTKGPYPLERLPSGDSVGGQILNIFNMDSQPTLQRVGRQLWRVGQRLHNACTHTPIVEELALDSALESADYSPESADYNANPPKGTGLECLLKYHWFCPMVLMGPQNCLFTNTCQSAFLCLIGF